MIDQNQLEGTAYFTYLNNLTASDTRHTHGIKSRIAMAQAPYDKKEIVTTKID
jgi:hypothetical protein